MPTIYRERNWAVKIFTDDHPPPHVHVLRPGGLVKIQLEGPDGAPDVTYVRNLNAHDAWRALAIVYQHQDVFLAHWRHIHGS